MPATARTLTPEQYFAWEPTQAVRHEYHFGEVRPMPDVTFGHATATVHLLASLVGALRGTDCRALPGVLRVQVLRGHRYVYPDATVHCGAPAFVNERRTTLTNPAVVFEVLSDETRSYDLDGKFALYRGVPSVRAVGFVEPERRWVQVAHRDETGWRREAPVSEGAVEIGALGVTLALGDL